jgi:hypothetical protein
LISLVIIKLALFTKFHSKQAAGGISTWRQLAEGEDRVLTRAQMVWKILKEFGLYYDGPEEHMLEGLEAQLAQNHPS